MRKFLAIATLSVFALTGCGGGGSADTGWDWDGFLVNGSTQWRCRDIGSGQFAPDSACSQLQKTDQRWPTAGVSPALNGGWSPGVAVSTVCSAQMADYKIKMGAIQSLHTEDYAAIGVAPPATDGTSWNPTTGYTGTLIDGVITKHYFDLRDALWEATPYIAITKPSRKANDGTLVFNWPSGITNSYGGTPYVDFHTNFWREDSGDYGILWKKSEFHWAIWVIVKGKCGSFNMENGNYKGLSVLE